MKKYLKFLLLPVLASTPALLVVSCSSEDSKISDQDILNSAEGAMQNRTFDMTKLQLENLPEDDAKYDSLSDEAKNIISSYYSELVKNGLNWDYPDVSVQITSSNGLNFRTKYGPNVESAITLNAVLTYKNLPTVTKKIIVKINNDTTNDSGKIQAIGEYLKKYLNDNDNHIFNLQTLLPDDLKSNEAKYLYNQITSALRTDLFTKPASEDDSTPVIDVEGVNLEVLPLEGDQEKIIYNMAQSAINQENKTINGLLENLILQLAYPVSGEKYQLKLPDLNSKNLKVAQKFSDTDNQLNTILNQPNQALVFYKDDLNDSKLPTDKQSLADYDPTNTFTEKIKIKLFELVSAYYPENKMTIGDKIWNANLITILNSTSSNFILDDSDPNNHYGHFQVDIAFKFQLVDDPQHPVTIETDVKNLQLNLTDSR